MLERSLAALTRRGGLCWALGFGWLAACQGSHERAPVVDAAISSPGVTVDVAPDTDALDAGSTPDAAAPAAAAPQIPPERLALCARPADDAVRDIFCKGEKLGVNSLRELLARLQIRT